jgi:hypothetical protein
MDEYTDMRDQFDRLYAALQNIFAGWAIESPYGANWNSIKGDYFVVDDFHEFHQKIYLWRWEVFSVHLLKKIRTILAGGFEKWDVMVQVLADDMEEHGPTAGMIVSYDGIRNDVAKIYYPYLFINIRPEDLSQLTTPDV